jgi:Spy/CpxP family protein refolding chaperone
MMVGKDPTWITLDMRFGIKYASFTRRRRKGLAPPDLASETSRIQHMRTRNLHLRCLRLFVISVVAGSCFSFVAADNLQAQTPNSPAPVATPGSDPALAQQLLQLQARVAQLEAALAKSTPAMTPVPATTPAPAMAGMSAGAAPAAGANGMMGMMDKMMGMMDKMMPSAGGMPMPSRGSMPAPATGTSNSGSMTQSSVPGVPGASRLYHIGATGFFLDHPQHITLTTEQQAALNKIKTDAVLAKSTADRAAEQAEQALWLLTAADQPDAVQIEAKVREIEKLRGDERLAFIRAVGDASKILTEEQRKILVGFGPAAPANTKTTPPAAMPPGAMKKDM